MYFDTYEFMNCYKSNTYYLITSINNIAYKITLSRRAKTSKKPWNYKICILSKLAIDTGSLKNNLFNYEDISATTEDNSIICEDISDEILYDSLEQENISNEILYDSLEQENTPNKTGSTFLGYLLIPDKLNDLIICEISPSEIRKTMTDIKTILSKIRNTVKELRKYSNNIEISPIKFENICLDIMKFPAEITKTLHNIKITNDEINFKDKNNFSDVTETILSKMKTTDIELFIKLLLSLAKKIQIIISDIKKTMDILEKDATIDKQIFDKILIAGDSRYIQTNVRKFSEDDIKKIYIALLSKDISSIPELLSFISNYGLPSSDAYAFINRKPKLYFKEYYPDLNLTLPLDFQDTCYLTHAQNSLLVIKYLYELKEFCNQREKLEENEISIIIVILNLMIHFNFTHLNIEIEDTLSPTTDSGLFIQDLFKPYIDITSKAPLSDKMLKGMLSGEYYQTKTTRFTGFNTIYNTEQCYRLYKITLVLLDVCNEKEISLKELSKNPKKYELSVSMHKSLRKLKTNELYDTAHSTFVDLLFEGLTTCTPKFDWNEKEVNYKLNTPTLLQALYLQLYTYSGKLRRCLHCGSLFEVGNRKNKKYCSEECGHCYASKKAYYKKNN